MSLTEMVNQSGGQISAFSYCSHKGEMCVFLHSSGQSNTSHCNCQPFKMLFIFITQRMLNFKLLCVHADYYTSLLCVVQDTGK